MSDITAEMIKDLRERTGVGMSKCKEALVETDGNMDKAIEYLRKAGIATAVKKESREAKEGMISSAENHDAIAILEINAETDFVIKNENFQSFAHSLSQLAVKEKPKSLEEFMNMGSNVDPLMTVDQARHALILKFGENIQIKNLEVIKKDRNSSYGIYSHMGGKIVTMVELSGSASEHELARNLAMHVAAENPDYLKAEDVPEDIKNQEGEIARSQVKNKPDNIIQKIVDGKIKAFCDQICFLSQNYIKENSKTVQAVVEEHGKKIGKPLQVVRFWRWQVGQNK